MKKIAHKQQAAKNVEIKKGKIQMVKKNYKGNIEAYKKHSEIPSFYDENMEIQFDTTDQAEV